MTDARISRLLTGSRSLYYWLFLCCYAGLHALAAAEHLPPEQILAAPDCGLVKLDVPTARAKLQAMAAGARLARERM
jgi:hypothetical protein